MPFGDTLRSGPTGSATEMCHDRRAVDVEPRSQLSDRCASPSLVDEIVYPRRVEARLSLTPRSDASCSVVTTPSGIFEGCNVLTRPFRV